MLEQHCRWKRQECENRRCARKVSQCGRSRKAKSIDGMDINEWIGKIEGQDAEGIQSVGGDATLSFRRVLWVGFEELESEVAADGGEIC